MSARLHRKNDNPPHHQSLCEEPRLPYLLMRRSSEEPGLVSPLGENKAMSPQHSAMSVETVGSPDLHLHSAIIEYPFTSLLGCCQRRLRESQDFNHCSAVMRWSPQCVSGGLWGALMRHPSPSGLGAICRGLLRSLNSQPCPAVPRSPFPTRKTY